MVTINQLANYAIKASGKNLKIKNLFGEEFESKYGFKCPLGVKGRNSKNDLYKQHMNWEPTQKLELGIKKTYDWIKSQNE